MILLNENEIYSMYRIYHCEFVSYRNYGMYRNAKGLYIDFYKTKDTIIVDKTSYFYNECLLPLLSI